MKIQITIDCDDVTKMPLDEISDKQMQKATDALPKNAVKLPKEETGMHPGQNAKPLMYTVKKGDTLKKISKQFGISYGELSTHLLTMEGSTSIRAGQEIKIPRHFIDLSHA